MGWYENRVFPWLNDKLCADPELERLRREALQAASGRVLEVGFGSGLNLEHYPAGATSIVAVEPNEGMLQRAATRIATSRIPVEVIAGPGETLPLPDESFDTAVLVLTLCSVADPGRVVSEIRRVLKRDGRLVVFEHGLSDDSGVARWQKRLNRLQNIVACGCNINRPIRDLVARAGFRFDPIRQFYVPKMPRTHGWVTMGVATKV
jgi:ubiquinone/menaquinone biosynthesis C-methylase UbiE